MGCSSKAGVLFLVLLCTQRSAAEAVGSPGTATDADEQFQQAVALLKSGTATDAAGAASILASLVSLRIVPQIPADKHASAAFSPDSDAEDFERDEQDLEQDPGMHEDTDGREGTAKEAARRAPLLRHPGVEVDHEAHGPALRELSRLFGSGHGVAADHRLSYALMEAAAARGDPLSQGVQGLQQSLGLHPPTQGSHRSFSFGPSDTPRALLNYYFAASGNDSFSQMVLGYRHAHGLGVPQSCEAAVLYYHPVAEETIALAAVPNSLPLVERERGRLTQRSVHQQRQTREQEMMHYQWFADMGNVDAQRAVGHMLTHGPLQDPARALQYFERAAEAGDPDALAHLGHMYANGLGVPADNATAVEYFTDAVQESGHPAALFGLGYMHMSGYGVEKDLKKAFQFFAAAAEQHHTESTFHLGLMYLHGWGVRQDKLLALRHLSLAAKVGHPLAMYNMAMLHLGPNPALPPSCPTALDLLKRVAEKGPQAACLQDGLEAFFASDFDKALLLYLKAAEMGMELGQANAAWMLSHGYGYDKAGAAPVAVALHQRAAAQGNVEALLSIGDSYYYGRGVPRDWQRAAQVYGEAAARRNAQALFNLGFMHEYGAGLPQDLHLAKRHYDKAAAAQPDAAGAARLALLSLWLHGAWLKVAPTLAPGWVGLWDLMFLRQEPTLGFGGGMGEQSGFGFVLLMARPVLRVAFGWLHSLLDLEGSSSYGQGPQALQAGDAQEQQEQEGFSHEEAQHQGLWANVSSWLGGENVETLVLVALCLGLWAVVGRRQALRRRHRHITRPRHPPAATHSSAAGPGPTSNSNAAASGQAPIMLPPAQTRQAQDGPSTAPPGDPSTAPATADAGATASPRNAVGLGAVAGLVAGSATSPAEVAGQAAATRADATGSTREMGVLQTAVDGPAGGTASPSGAQPAHGSISTIAGAAAPSLEASPGVIPPASQSPAEATAPAARQPAGASDSTPMASVSAPDADLHVPDDDHENVHPVSQERTEPVQSASGQSRLETEGHGVESASAAGPSTGSEAAGLMSEAYRHDWQAAVGSSQAGSTTQPRRASDAWWAREDQPASKTPEGCHSASGRPSSPDQNDNPEGRLQ